MGAIEWLLLLILSVLWGGSFFFVGVAVKTLPPFTIVALRVGLAAIALNLVVRATCLRVKFSFARSKQRGYFVGLDALRAFLNEKTSCFSLVLRRQNTLDTGHASDVIPD